MLKRQIPTVPGSIPGERTIKGEIEMNFKKIFLLILLVLVVIAVTGLLTKLDISQEPIETEKIAGEIIDKDVWWLGPFQIGEDGPWYYWTYAKVKIRCVNGEIYSHQDSRFSVLILDPRLGFNVGDKVIVFITTNNRCINYVKA